MLNINIKNIISLGIKQTIMGGLSIKLVSIKEGFTSANFILKSRL